MKTALCCIAKCENLYLDEWVSYHLLLGFDHIYIYDNNDFGGERCADAVSGYADRVSVLKYYIGVKQSGCETQVAAYNDFYRRFGGKYDWVLYIDVDEFLVLRGYPNVRNYLSAVTRPSVYAVELNWVCYGDGGNLHYEPLPVRERFTEACEDPELGLYRKHFYRMRVPGFRMLNVHYGSQSGVIVDCEGNTIEHSLSVKSKVSNTSVAYIAHYATKSADEYVAIKKRRRGAGIGNDRLSIDHYFKFNERTAEKEKYLEDLMSGKTDCGWFEGCRAAARVEAGTSGISVYITAWKAERYIEDCLDSVYAQDYMRTNDNWEVIVGVDACPSTLSKMKRIMRKYRNLRVFLMDRNCGTYVTSNTMASMARYDRVMRFDSDDLMLPHMVSTVMSVAAEHDSDVIKYRCKTFNDDGVIDPDRYAEGSICIKKDLFVEYGGYMPWKCSADSELRKRLRPVLDFHYINEPLYMLRRDNGNSLTVSGGTDMKSEYRREREEYIETKSLSAPKIMFTSAGCKEVLPDRVVVNFTTWRKRDVFVPEMLDNFALQTKKPDAVVCWLSEDEYGGQNVPESISPYAERGDIEIRWLKDNIYSHKRYECFREDGNCVNILVDDDILYDPDYVESLYEASVKHPDCAICYISNRMRYTETGRAFAPIMENPSVYNYYLSGMACFPPFVFPSESFGHTDIRDSVAAKCDDSWVSAWLIKYDIPVYAVHGRDKRWRDIEDAQYCSLWNENKVLVDGVMKKTRTFFDVCRAIGVYGKVTSAYGIDWEI